MSDRALLRHKAAARRFAVVVLAVALCAGAPLASSAASAAIASAHPQATAAGHEILKRGGNAFDAAVAVAAALAVVEPYSSGLGGGGFWLLHRARDGHEVMVDARETAPAAVDISRYVDAAGKPIAQATLRGGTAVGIPGVPAGLALLARKYGRLPLRRSLAPAIAIARNGFNVDNRYVNVARVRERLLRDDPKSSCIFLVNDGVPAPGHRLRQPELAATLALVARRGHEGFYRGKVARALVAAVNAAGGVWQPSDLAEYRVIERTPVRMTYRGAAITTATLPSGGGVTLAQALNMLEPFQIADPRAVDAAHVVVEALRRGFQDRTQYLGDSDFAAVPVARLLDRQYARRRAAGIDLTAATQSENLLPESASTESGNTTHYSIVDAADNRVAATLTINTFFGSGIVAGDAGILLNNEMDDFTLPAAANTYGLRGGAANGIAPRKRPLSSMTPTFVEDRKGVLVIGAPGGPRIVSMVLLGVLDYLNHDVVDLARIVSAPRYHHEYLPDRVEIEPEGFSAEWRGALEAKGHRLAPASRKWGNMQVVYKPRSGPAAAASDPRGSDLAWY